jgi:hypothetical protein
MPVPDGHYRRELGSEGMAKDSVTHAPAKSVRIQWPAAHKQ